MVHNRMKGTLHAILTVFCLFLSHSLFAQINTGGGGGGSGSFTDIISGTNTQATMTVGSGAAMTYSGTGTLNSSNSPLLLTAFPLTAYGGVCDDSANNDTAFTNAIAAATANGGGTILLPLGTCRVSSTITITAANVGITGQSELYTIIKMMAAGTPTLLVGPAACTPCSQDNRFYNFTLSRSVAATGASYGIELRNAAWAEVRRVRSYDSQAAFELLGGSNDYFYDDVAGATINAETLGNAFYLNGSGNSIFYENCSTFGINGVFTYAFNALNAADVWVDGLNVGAGGGAVTGSGNIGDIHFNHAILEPQSAAGAIIFTSLNGSCGLSAPCQWSFVDAHVKNGTFGTAILITNSQGIQFIGGEFFAEGSFNTFYITGANSTNNIIQGTHIAVVNGNHTATPIVLIAGAHGNIVNGNTILAPTGTPMANAVYVSGSTNNVITNNVVNGFGVNAFNFVDAGAGPNVFKNNVVEGTFTGARVVNNATTGVTDNWEDYGTCTMTTGACAAQTFGSGTYAIAPTHANVTWTGVGTCIGALSYTTTVSTITPVSSSATDTCVVSWRASGN